MLSGLFPARKPDTHPDNRAAKKDMETMINNQTTAIQAVVSKLKPRERLARKARISDISSGTTAINA